MTKTKKYSKIVIKNKVKTENMMYIYVCVYVYDFFYKY